MAEAWHSLADGKSLLGEGGRGLLNDPKARATGECEGRRQGQCMTGGKGRNSNSLKTGSGPVEAGGRGHETADAAHSPYSEAQSRACRKRRGLRAGPQISAMRKYLQWFWFSLFLKGDRDQDTWPGADLLWGRRQDETKA